MAWLDIDEKLIEAEIKKQENSGFISEPGVYDVIIKNIYLDKTSGGSVFFGLQTNRINFEGFSVERLVKNKEGKPVMSNGRPFTGVILLDKIAKCKNKSVNQLVPTKMYIEIFGNKREVGVFKDLVNTEITIGVRTRRYAYNGEMKEKLELVDTCYPLDDGCREKLEERIEKKPVIFDKSLKELEKPSSSDEEIPF